MSIADDEAEKAYPTRYWNGTHVKEQFYCDTDDLQEAYLRGRAAPPADAEVEAVAKKLWWWDVDSDWEDVMTSDEFIDGQDQLAYKHQSNRADILRTLKLKAEVNQ